MIIKKTTKNTEHLSNYVIDKSRRHCVYYLPNEHYIGITSQLKPEARINKHRFLGMNCNDWIILREFTSREAARHYENLWHSYLGANGINLNN